MIDKKMASKTKH